MKTNPAGPLYYAKTGRPAAIIETLPVVKFRVQFSNGNVAEMTQEQLDEQFTNTRPSYTFDASFACGHLIVRGMERHVDVRVRRKYADFPGQSLNREDAMALYDNLGRWLADRMPVPEVMMAGAQCGQAPMTPHEQDSLAKAMTDCDWRRP